MLGILLVILYSVYLILIILRNRRDNKFFKDNIVNKRGIWVLRLSLFDFKMFLFLIYFIFIFKEICGVWDLVEYALF